MGVWLWIKFINLEVDIKHRKPIITVGLELFTDFRSLT